MVDFFQTATLEYNIRFMPLPLFSLLLLIVISTTLGCIHKKKKKKKKKDCRKNEGTEMNLVAFRTLIIAKSFDGPEQERDAAEERYENIPAAEKDRLLRELYYMTGDNEKILSDVLYGIRKVVVDHKDIVDSWDTNGQSQLITHLLKTLTSDALSDHVKGPAMHICTKLFEYGTIPNDEVCKIVYAILLASDVKEDNSVDWLTFDGVTEIDYYTSLRTELEDHLFRHAQKMRSHFKKALMGFIKDDKWEVRCTGIRSIAAVDLANRKVDKKFEMIDKIVNSLKDPHPRVRSAACCTLSYIIGQNHTLELQKTHHSLIVPALISVLSSDEIPRVAAEAARTLQQFFHTFIEMEENGDTEDLGVNENTKIAISGFYDDVIRALANLINSKYSYLLAEKKFVLLTTFISAVISLGETENDVISKYHSVLIIPLKSILKLNKDCIILIKNVFTCVALLGVSVKRDLFVIDASEVMQSIVSLVGSTAFLDLLHDRNYGWSRGNTVGFSFDLRRMASAMGDAFIPFLPSILPLIILTLENPRHDVKMCCCQEEELKMAMVCNITHFAKDYPHSFRPFVDRVSLLATKELSLAATTLKNEESRLWPLEVVPLLIDCCRGDQKTTFLIFTRFVNTVKEVLKADRKEREITAALLVSLAGVIRQIGLEAIPKEERRRIRSMTKKRAIKKIRGRLEKKDKDVLDKI